MLTEKGLAAGAKLFAGWDGLHACCPKRDILPNADPGELNPKDGWPNDDDWFSAAATDPNNPLDAAVVEGDPKIDDVVLVVTGAPKTDKVFVDAEPNIELDDAGTTGLPNIDELVVAGEPKTVVVWAGDPKPEVVLVVVTDPNMEDTVVMDGVPNIDVVLFIGFPKMDDEVVVDEAPNIEGAVLVLVGAPNIVDALVVFVVAPKMDGATVVLVGVLNIEGAQVLFVGVLKVEVVLFVLIEEPKIDGVLVVFVGGLKIEAWLDVVVEFPKMLVVLVDDLIAVLKIEIFVDGISKICALLAVTGNLGDSSFSGVTGSDIIGVGLSDTWEVVSVTLLFIVADTALKSSAVLRVPKLDDTVGESTGSLTTTGVVFGGCEKLNDDVTVVVGIEVKGDLVSDAVVLGVVKLNVENDAVSGFELNLKVVSGVSFSGTVSCLFFDFSSAVIPEKKLGVSEGFGVSKLNVDNGIVFGLVILFLIASEKLKFTVAVDFGTVISVFTVDTLEKLKGIFSFASVVPEIISKVDLVDTILLESLKFKDVDVNDFKLKSTGSLLETAVVVTLFRNNGAVLAELKTIGSLVKTL